MNARVSIVCGLSLSLGWLMVSTAPARASGQTAVVVSGSAPTHERQVASVAISAAVANTTGNAVSTATLSAHDAATLTRCMTNEQPWTCMSSTLRGKEIQQLAMVSVDTQTSRDGSPMIVITEQLVAAELFAPVGDKRFCDHCTDDVLGKLATDLTLDMLREVAVRGGRTVVVIKSVPSSAHITFDDKLVGATDKPLTTYPGTHKLSLRLDGFQIATRPVVAVEGKTTEITVTMVPGTGSSTGPPLGPDPHEGPVVTHDRFRDLPRYVPWLGIGVGGAAIATGAVLVLVDGKPSADPNVEQSRHYYATRVPGIVTGVAGLLSLGAGLYVRHRQNTPSSTITAMPLQGGASVHWITSF